VVIPASFVKSKTAVVVIDYQPKTLGFFSKEFQNDIIARANKVLSAVRQKGIPVFFVNKGEGTPDVEIHPQIIRQPQDVVLIKKNSGAFSTTNLDERMKKLGIDTLVIMGIFTSGAVMSTLRWGADINYKLYLISDCCMDRDPELHKVLLEKVFYHQSTVIPAKGFLELLEKS
jgi:nicotinamidase-related amidase